MNAHEIKQLQVRLTKAKAKRDTARAEFEMSREAFKCAQLAVESLETQLNRATTDLIITEHALLRFIERSMDLTLGSIEENIREKVAEHAKFLGDGRYPLGGDLCAVVRDNRVVTIEYAR